MASISFDINLKYIYYILILIVYIIRQLIIKYSSSLLIKQSEAEDYFFQIYSNTISNFFAIFLICISKIRSKKKNKIISEKKNLTNIKLIKPNGKLPINLRQLLIRPILVSISDFFAQYILFLFYFFTDANSNVLKFVYSMIIVRILSSYLLNRIILKMYFYKHHFLSFIINLISLIFLATFDITHIIKSEYKIISIIYILALSVNGSLYSLENVIGKKALIEDFLNPYYIIFFRGVYEIILLIIFSIPFFFIKNKDNKLIFSSFINKFDDFKKILLYCLTFILTFIYNVFLWIIIDKFSPNHIATTQIFEGIIRKFIRYENFKDNLINSIIELIIYFILMIGSFIHNEIIILNFCGFNKYTELNIIKDGIKDYNLAFLDVDKEDSSDFNEESKENSDIDK